MIAAPMSTSLFEFISFGYGKPIILFESVTVVISSAVFDSWIQAWGLLAATSLRPAYSSPRNR